MGVVGRGNRLQANPIRKMAAAAFDSMVVRGLADNPFRRFYEGLGGKLIGEKDIVIGGQTLVEVAYGWDELEALAENAVA